MTIYVDEPQTWKAKFKDYCHCWSDGDVQELHDAMQAIGVKREWFQNKDSRFQHYDLSKGKRDMAITHGAVKMSLLSWIRQGGLKQGAKS